MEEKQDAKSTMTEDQKALEGIIKKKKYEVKLLSGHEEVKDVEWKDAEESGFIKKITKQVLFQILFLALQWFIWD